MSPPPPAAPGRTVSLLVVDGEGALSETVEPFEVDLPWWQEVAPIQARHRDLVVLRLVDATPAPDHPMGGAVTYLASVEGSASPGLGLRPSDRTGVLDPHPLRMWWADPATAGTGPAWFLDRVGATGPATQHRTWNLSTLWSVPAGGDRFWFKAQPPFMAHEGLVLRSLACPLLPPVLDTCEHGIILPELVGVDGWGIGAGEWCAVLDDLIEVQLGTVERDGELVDAGVPDRRSAWLVPTLRDLVARLAPGDGPLAELADGLADRMADVAACGLPDVVLHGDAHPGNIRIGGERPVLFDWGDSAVANPLLDLAVLTPPVDATRRAVRDHWLDAWKRAVPGSDPHRAALLLEPVLPLLQAWTYRHFLDNIEPDEHVYHRDDVPERLAVAATARLVETGSVSGPGQ